MGRRDHTIQPEVTNACGRSLAEDFQLLGESESSIGGFVLSPPVVLVQGRPKSFNKVRRCPWQTSSRLVTLQPQLAVEARQNALLEQLKVSLIAHVPEDSPCL
jgi:hypothetical protein